MRITSSAACAVLLQFIASAAARAQAPAWNSTLTVNPNPSPYYREWERDPTTVMLILNYSGKMPASFRFFVQITRIDGTALLTTQSDEMTMPPGPTVQTYNSTSIIQWNNAKFDPAVRDQIVRTGMLPEGTYTLCVATQDVAGNELTKACAQFAISLPAQPPQLIAPANNDTMTVSPLQFTWSPVVGVRGGASIQYRVSIKEILQGQDFALAMQANPAIYSGAIGMTTLVYPATAQPLESGKRYVWQVQALNAQGNPAAANDGKSEIWQFVYEEKKPVFKILPHINEQNAGTGMTFFKLSATVHGTLLYEFSDPGEYLGKPLANTAVQLVEKYYIKTADKGKVFLSGYPGADQVLAAATTDANGDFTFSYFTNDTMGLLKANATVITGGGEFTNTYTGNLYRVARLIVENPATSYYCSPDNDIIVTPYAATEAGKLFAYVRSYALQVQALPVQWDFLQQATQSPLPGVEVYLLRQARPPGVPGDEGPQPPVSPQTKTVAGTTYTVVGKAVTNQNGIATFRRAVKNIGPNDEYYISAEPDPTGEYRYVSLGAVSFQFPYTFFLNGTPNYTVSGGNYGDNATFDADYAYPTVTTSITMLPLDPYISGNIYRSDNHTVPVHGANVELDIVPLIFPIPLEVASQTGGWNGSFGFDHLKINYDKNNQLNSVYVLNITKYGFRDTTIKNIPPLKLGLQYYIDRMYLQPAARVHGTIADEDGNPVSAHVTIGAEGATVYAAGGVQFSKKGKYGWSETLLPAKFDAPATLGLQRIIIDPDDKSDYFSPDTAYVVVSQSDQDLGVLTVYKKIHRVRVNVYQLIPGALKIIKGKIYHSAPHKGPPIVGAHVAITNVNPPLSATTNDGGYATFKFQSSGDNFGVKVTAPDDNDYVGQDISVTAPESKDWTNADVLLVKASRIFGKVYAGASPVAGARVFLDEAASEPVETYSDKNGSYVLHNIPVGIHKFKAVKSASNFIGDSATVNTGTNADSVNFNLKVYGDMDITRLLGFPIEVETLDSTGAGVKIGGAFVKLPANGIFGADSSLRLEFKNVYIQPGAQKNGAGIPYAYPASLPVATDQNTTDVKIYGVMFGKQRDTVNGIRVADQGSGIGVIHASVYIDAGSFSSSSIKFDGGRVALSRPDVSGGGRVLPTFIAGGMAPVAAPEGLLATSASGGSLHYTLFGFDADADSSASFVHGDTVRLATTLHTNLANITPADIALKIGDVLLHTASLDPVGGEDTISIPMEKWALVSGKWGIGSSGFVMDGVIRTGVVDVPFVGMQVKPTQLQYGAFTFGSLKLAGIVPLAVTGNADFGYDGGIGHWSVTVTPAMGNSSCAALSALPGMNGGDVVSVNNFRFASDGTSGFTVDNTAPPVTLYNVATFYPNMLNVYDTYVSIPGTIDLHIPMVSEMASAASYSASGGKLALTVQSGVIGFTTNGVTLSFTGGTKYPQTLGSGGFVAKGTVEEAGKFKFNVTLYRTTDSTAIWIDPGQTLNISASGSTKLLNIAGGMAPAASSDWANLWFAGDLTGTNGASGRLQFTVYGDIVANGQQLGVKNMATPFGNLSFTYDFEKHQLEGSLHIEAALAGEGQVMGDADAVVDEEGWYFVAGGMLSLNNPKLDATAAIMFGSHSITPDLQNEFIKYSYKGKLPPSFKTSVKGFYFEGEVEVPVIIPSVDIDLGVISGHLFVDAGADVRMGMNFSDDGNTYYMGLDGFIHAGLGVGGSIVIACGGIDVDVLADVGFDGTYKSDGTWGIDGDASLTLTGSAYAGWGVCDSDCGGTFCDETDVSVSKTLGVHGHIGADGESMSFYFK